MPLPANLRQEFATLQKSFLDFAGLVGAGHVNNPDPTLQSRGRGQGLKLYQKVEEDCHASAVIQQRKFELIARPWKLESASDDQADIRARDLVEAQLKALGVIDYPMAREYGAQGFDGVALNFLDATFKGYAAGEVMWHQDGREVFAAEIRHRDQRRFGFTATNGGHELRLLTKTNWLTGEPIPPRKIIYHSPTAKDLNPYGLGLDSKIFWPVFFKRQSIQFWLIFADKFGSPTPLGKYAPGEKDENKAILLDALNNITQGLAATVPEGMTIEFIEAIRSGSVQTYEGLCRYMDEQISEAVLGQTGTTNQSSGGGSRARDEVAKTGTLALVQADGDLLARTLDRTLIRWIVELNRPILGDLARPPHLCWDFAEAEDVAARVGVDKTLYDMGFRLTLDKVVERYGEGYEERPATFPNLGNSTPAAPINLSDPLPLERFSEDDTLPPGELAAAYRDQARTTLGPVVDGWVDQIRGVLDAAEDFDQFSEGLIALYPELARDEFAETLRDSLLAAHLGGMSEVDQEAADAAD
jgi:phage gp29-like protein